MFRKLETQVTYAGMLQWIDAIITSNATPRHCKPHRFDRFIICNNGGRWHHLVRKRKKTDVMLDSRRRMTNIRMRRLHRIETALSRFAKHL